MKCHGNSSNSWIKSQGITKDMRIYVPINQVDIEMNENSVLPVELNEKSKDHKSQQASSSGTLNVCRGFYSNLSNGF